MMLTNAMIWEKLGALEKKIDQILAALNKPAPVPTPQPQPTPLPVPVPVPDPVPQTEVLMI